MTITAALFIGLEALAASVPPASLSDAVEFSSSPRGHILLPASINGSEPLAIVLDTGAERSVVTQRLADRLGLVGVSGKKVNTLGVHGKTENALVDLQEITVGQVRATDIQAVVLDLDHITRGKWHADGILGMDFLRQFDVQLNFKTHTARFYPPTLDFADCPACPGETKGTEFRTIDPGFIVLPAYVDGIPMNAVLDTGSGHSGLNSIAASALGVPPPPTPAGAPAGHGFGVQTGPLRIGDASLADRVTFRIMDHPVMEALGLADGAAMLLGTDQLAGRTLTISYGLSLLFIE